MSHFTVCQLHYNNDVSQNVLYSYNTYILLVNLKPVVCTLIIIIMDWPNMLTQL